MAIIEVKGLSKTYGQGSATVTALNSVSLVIEKGQFVAVMGPSGCGKSTLLHLIGGLDLPSAGSVWIDGKDISKMDDTTLTEMRRRQMGFVFQFYNLIPVLSAEENAALPLILDGIKPEQARACAAKCSRVTRWATGSPTAPTSFRAGSSSEWRSRARW